MRYIIYAVMGRMGLGANTGSRSNQVVKAYNKLVS